MLPKHQATDASSVEVRDGKDPDGPSRTPTATPGYEVGVLTSAEKGDVISREVMPRLITWNICPSTGSERFVTQFHTRRRRIASLLATVLLGIVSSVFVSAQPAQAASLYMYHGPGSSYGYYNQNVNTNFLRLLTSPASMTTGRCLDTWYDWERGNVGPGESEHFDARVSRSCRSFAQRDTGSTYEVASAYFVGIQKVGVCYGLDDATATPLSNCYEVLPLTGVVDSVPNPCTRTWYLSPAGTAAYYGGGDSYSCTS